jgi:hypothetical protein
MTNQEEARERDESDEVDKIVRALASRIIFYQHCHCQNWSGRDTGTVGTDIRKATVAQQHWLRWIHVHHVRSVLSACETPQKAVVELESPPFGYCLQGH